MGDYFAAWQTKIIKIKYETVNKKPAATVLDHGPMHNPTAILENENDVQYAGLGIRSFDFRAKRLFCQKMSE